MVGQIARATKTEQEIKVRDNMGDMSSKIGRSEDEIKAKVVRRNKPEKEKKGYEDGAKSEQ